MDTRRSSAANPGDAWDCRPMLATSGPLPEGPLWCYEFKWDGVRALVSVRSEAEGGIRICARSGADITVAYPEVVRVATDLLAELDGTPVRLDGEIVAFDQNGRPSFETLQSRMAVSSASRAARLAAQAPVAFMAFDVLQIGGDVTLDQPYERRRRLLEALPLDVPPSICHDDMTGAQVLQIARSQGLEGVVAKRRDRPYEPGRRSACWVKVPLRLRQDVVIGGWEPGQQGRAGQLGALLVGVYDETGQLCYAGQVGTGFTDRLLREVKAKLTGREVKDPPFADLSSIPARNVRDARWVRPDLVASVEFRNWTSEGRLRAPSFKGLRPDIRPEGVVRDT